MHKLQQIIPGSRGADVSIELAVQAVSEIVEITQTMVVDLLMRWQNME